jgi:hypothetical protein
MVNQEARSAACAANWINSQHISVLRQNTDKIRGFGKLFFVKIDALVALPDKP